MEPLSVGVGLAGKALATAVARKGSEAAIKWLNDPNWRRALAKEATDQVGISAGAPAVESWLGLDETRELLSSTQSETSTDRLRQSLLAQLTDDWSLRVGAPPGDAIPLEAIADAVLDRVLTDFLSFLDPSVAIAVADERSRQRADQLRADIKDVQAKLAAGDEFEPMVARFPRIVRESLRALRLVDQGRASVIARLGSDENEATADPIGELFRGPTPALFEEAPVEFWLALANLAAVIGARAGEATAIDRAIDLGAAPRARLLARVALAYAAAGDVETSNRRLKAAQEVDPSDLFVRFVEAMIANDPEGMIVAAEHLPTFVEGVSTKVACAIALAGMDRLDEAIGLLGATIDEEPESTAAMTWKAQLLLTKAHGSKTGDEARGLRSAALELARSGRDLRRRWGGPSGECVEVMAKAAMTMGDLRLAMAVCTTDGEANVAESRWPGVQEIVVSLLVDSGNHQAAVELADRIESPYHQLIARGALAAESGRREEAEEHLTQALDLAKHEGERYRVVRHMAVAGVWPLPDFDQIATRDKEDADFIQALSLLARDETEAAIPILRTHRRKSTQFVSLLATAYSKAGRLDDAVGELQEGARHFRDPELTARAAFMLADHHRHEQAFNLAERVVNEIPPDSRALPRLRALLFNGLAARRDWAGAEEQARRLLERDPSSLEAGWALASALLNQTRLGEAWQVIGEHRLEIRNVEDAKVWIALAARYLAAQEWVPTGLDVVGRYPGSEDVAALMLISTVRTKEPALDSDTGERVKAAWSKFFERFPESEMLRTRSIGETDDEMLELLRNTLEPGADAALEQARAVEDGRVPLGLLATAAKKSYLEAWISGGTGTLLIYIPIKEVMDMESPAAAVALDHEVALDGSALAVLSLLPELAGQIMAAFRSCRIPSSLRQDAVQAVDTVNSPSEGLMGWDPEAGRPTMTTFSADELDLRRTRAKWVEDRVVEIEAKEVAELSAFPEANIKAWWWLASLQLAIDEHLPFYCDDAWLRRLASSHGVQSFGTVDLLSLLVSTGQIAPDVQRAALAALRGSRAVLLPMTHDDLLRLAASDAWNGNGVAALQVAQSAFWADPQAAAAYDAILVLVARNNPSLLPQWLVAGALGATRGAPPETRMATSARLLAFTLANYGQPAIVVGLVSAARMVANRVEAGDPVPMAGLLLRDILVGRLGYRDAAMAIVTLTDGLESEDQHLLSRPFFSA